MTSIAYPIQLTLPFDGKRCSHCHICKPLAEYSKNKGEPDGLHHRCKHCRAEYNKTHKQQAGEYARRWRKAHPEQSRKLNTESRNRCKDTMRAYQLRWLRDHPDMKARQTARRRARKQNAEGSFTVQEWRTVKQAQDYRCKHCGRREPEIKLTVDHIVPLAQGGSNYISNIQALCRQCNSGKRDRYVG
jgi:5-methylcytosine-specific restriction endonuclease McrA